MAERPHPTPEYPLFDVQLCNAHRQLVIHSHNTSTAGYRAVWFQLSELHHIEAIQITEEQFVLRNGNIVDSSAVNELSHVHTLSDIQAALQRIASRE